MRIAVSRRRTFCLPSNLPSYFLFGEATPPPNPPGPPATKLRVMFRASLTQSVSCRSVCALKRALAFAACFLAASCLCFLFRRADGWHYERAITSSLCHSLLIQTPFDLKVRLSDARALFALRRRLERKQFARAFRHPTDG